MKNVAIRTMNATLQATDVAGVYGTVLVGLHEDTIVTVHDVTPIDGDTWFATVSLVNEMEPIEEQPAPPTKPKLVVAK